MNAPMFPGGQEILSPESYFLPVEGAIANGVAVEFGFRAESVLGE